MRVDTPDLATHLMIDPNAFLTPIGGILRRYSLGMNSRNFFQF